MSLASGGPVYSDVSSVPHNKLVFLPTVPGISCLNKDQENCELAENGHMVGPSPPCCLDYKIRFCCKQTSASIEGDLQNQKSLKIDQNQNL